MLTQAEREKIAESICDEFCRFPREWDEDKEGITLEDGMCRYCPLERLVSDGAAEAPMAE